MAEDWELKLLTASVEVVCIDYLGYVRGLRDAVNRCQVLSRSMAVRTQRSSRPARLILEPARMAGPLYVQGPMVAGALCTAILPPVEKRK